ncbi:MAG: hypothetical protein RIT81_13875 [Deltaproteobacteria bacterium]
MKASFRIGIAFAIFVAVLPTASSKAEDASRLSFITSVAKLRIEMDVPQGYVASQSSTRDPATRLPVQTDACTLRPDNCTVTLHPAELPRGWRISAFVQVRKRKSARSQAQRGVEQTCNEGETSCWTTRLRDGVVLKTPVWKKLSFVRRVVTPTPGYIVHAELNAEGMPLNDPETEELRKRFEAAFASIRVVSTP